MQKGRASEIITVVHIKENIILILDIKTGNSHKIILTEVYSFFLIYDLDGGEDGNTILHFQHRLKKF